MVIDACGRRQPQSQKVECYSKHNCPHPVPPQEAVDAFKRNELDKRLNNVLLCVDGRANPLKHALDNFKLVADVAAAKATLKKAEEARADHPAYHTYKEADWIKLREDIKVAQKTIAHYDGTYVAMLQNWIQRTGRSGRVMVVISAFESDGQLVYLLNAGVVDYLICDDSDLMCLGAPKQYSGYMNSNKLIPRRHTIFRLELELALKSMFSSASSSSSSSSSAPSSSSQRYSLDQLLPVLATVLGNDNFPWSLATLYVVMLCCNRRCRCRRLVLVLVLVLALALVLVLVAPSLSSTHPSSLPSTC